MALVFPLIWAACLLHVAFSLPELNIAAALRRDLSAGAVISLPDDATFMANTTDRWNIFAEPSYIGTIKPTTEDDITNAIRVLAKYGLPFLATAGSCGVTSTMEKLQNGLQIDLGGFDSVEINAGQNLLTVGGGVVFGQVIDPLYDAGKEIPLPSLPCVGIVSTALGGGLSRLQGLHGLLVDLLVSARMVVASGEIVTVSENENEDLYWAIRGAGQNFGIVVSATFRIFNATSGGKVINADFSFPVEANRSVWELVELFDETLPAELALSVFIEPDVTTREAVIWLNAVFYGTMAEADPYLKPMQALNPIASNISAVPWNREEMSTFFGFGAKACARGNRVNIYSILLNRTDVATWESHLANLTGKWAEYPDYAGRLILQRNPNHRVLDVADESTAYPFRHAKLTALFENWYTDSSLDRDIDQFMVSTRTKFQETGGLEALSVYSNYARGDEGGGSWYSCRKMKKLVELKQKWDPNGLFSWYNPIV